MPFNLKVHRPRVIIIITLDACRADHLGCYGYPLPTTPFLDHLASKSTLFEYAFSPIALTTPSHTSLLTGKYPSFHSIRFNNGDKPLNKEHEVTLPMILKEMNYKTAAFVSILPLHRGLGLDLGFDSYDDTLTYHELNRPEQLRRKADDTTDAMLKWIADNRRNPFFLWVHFAEPHGPYTPPPPYDNMFVGNRFYGAPLMLDVVPDYQAGGISTYQVLKSQRDTDGKLLDYERDLNYYLSQYDGYIRFVDDQLKKLVEKLVEWRLYDESLMIVTADHGESLGENNIYFFHSLTVSLEQIRVPLLVKIPSKHKIKEKKLTGPVSIVDIMPTVLGLCGYRAQYLGLQGEDLMPFIRNKGISWPERYIFSEIPTQLSVIDNRFQLLLCKPKEESEKYPYPPYVPAVEGVKLFDYIADPKGQRDLSAKHSDIVEKLQALADKYLKIPRPEYIPVNIEMVEQEKEEIKKRLEQLGYK